MCIKVHKGGVAHNNNMAALTQDSRLRFQYSSDTESTIGYHKNLALHKPVHSQVYIAQTTTIQVEPLRAVAVFRFF